MAQDDASSDKKDDAKKASDAPEQEASETSDAPEEVEAELVSDGVEAPVEEIVNEAEEPAAETADETIAAHESTDKDAAETTPVAASSSSSPGLILFGCFVLAAIGIIFLFNANKDSGGNTTPADETEIAAATPNALDSIGADAEDPVEKTVETPSEIEPGRAASDSPAIDSQDVAATDAPTTESDAVAAASTTEQTASTTEQTTSQVSIDDAAEAAADLFAADPDAAADQVAETIDENASRDADATADVETEAPDPRAAILALQRLAAERNDESESIESESIEGESIEGESIEGESIEGESIEGESEVHAAVETEISETAPSSDAAEAVAALVAAQENAPLEQDVAPATDADADAEAREASAEIGTVETQTEAAAPAKISNSATPAKPAASQTRADEFAEAARINAAETEKIANAISDLKEQLRLETEALNQSISEGREQSAQQSERINELRMSLETAIAERDARANREIEELRARIDKIQSGGAEIPASRQAAASLALVGLQRAFDNGEPFEDQLALLTRLAPEVQGVESLRASAREGAPTLAALKADFASAVREALAASGHEGGNGLVGRVQKLISVRPATPQPGDRPAAVISRAEAALEADNLLSTVEELAALSDGPADAFADWMEAARRRLNAAAAIETLNEALLREYEGE